MKKSMLFINKNKLFFTVIFIYIVILVLSPQKGISALKISAATLLNVVLIIFSVFVFVGLFQVWIHEDMIIKHLGHESGLKGLFLGALAGTALNGPLFTIFPLLKSLLKRGAKLSVVTVIFSTFAIKLPMLPLEISFLGWKFTLIHNGLIFLAAFIMAPLMEWIMGGSMIQDIEET